MAGVREVLLATFVAAVLLVIATLGVYLYVLWKTLRNRKHGVSARALVLLPLLSAVVVGCLAAYLPEVADRAMNKLVLDVDAWEAVTPTSTLFHRSLASVDLHGDSFIWTQRNVHLRGDIGHVDIPRLLDGSVALQCFSVVTKAPVGLNFVSNKNTTDMFTAVAVVQRWPLAAWTSLMERALFQVQRMHSAIEESDGRLVLVKTVQDLDTAMERWNEETAAVVSGPSPSALPSFSSALITIEGMHCVQGVMANLDKLFDAGVRMMGIAHFFDNELGGSNTGEEKHGLTALGREMVRRMQAKGIVVDVAHASDQVVRDVAAMATKPFVVSHTGVQGTCPSNRNLSDELLRAIADKGGIVGIAFFPEAVCGLTVDDIVKAVVYAVGVVGVDHVALGSDFDGTVKVPIDTSHLAALTHALLEAGLSKEDIAAISSGNALRVLRACLPEA